MSYAVNILIIILNNPIHSKLMLSVFNGARIYIEMRSIVLLGKYFDHTVETKNVKKLLR